MITAGSFHQLETQFSHSELGRWDKEMGHHLPVLEKWQHVSMRNQLSSSVNVKNMKLTTSTSVLTNIDVN